MFFSVIVYLYGIKKISTKFTNKPSLQKIASVEKYQQKDPETTTEEITVNNNTINTTKSTVVTKTKKKPSGKLLFEKNKEYSNEEIKNILKKNDEKFYNKSSGLLNEQKYFYITEQWQPFNEDESSNSLNVDVFNQNVHPAISHKEVYNDGAFLYSDGSGTFVYAENDNFKSDFTYFSKIKFDCDVYAKSGFSYAVQEVPAETKTTWTDSQGNIVKTEVKEVK